MKPEPLKGKIKEHSAMRFDKSELKKVVYVEDIKSAVEWLKSNLRKITFEGDWKNREKLINKAFEDVVKDGT